MIKADLKDSLRVLSDLFKDMKLPPLLERRIIESFLYANETVSTIFDRDDVETDSLMFVYTEIL